MLHALTTTWKATVAPRAPTPELSRLGPRSGAAVILLHASLAGLLAAGTYWVTQTRTIVWVPTPVTARAAFAASRPATGPATRPAPPIWTMPTPRERRRTMAQVWSDAHAGVWFGPIEGLAVGVGAALVGLTLALACTYLPCVHRGGALGRSWWLALAAATPASALLLLTVVVVLAGHLYDFRQADASVGGGWSEWGRSLVWSGLLPWCLLMAVVCTARSATCVGRARPAESATPLCEGCGYNLRGHTGSQRCPECGRPVAASLPPNHRGGPAWESGPRPRTLGHWLRTTADALLAPARFYRRLPVRRDVGRALSFEAATFTVVLLLACVMWFSIGLGFIAAGTTDLALWLLRSAWGAVIAWAGHRALATLVTTLWLVRGRISDGWAAARVAAYESAFVWPIIVWCMGLWLSFLRAGLWISALVDPQLASVSGAYFVLGVPIELWVWAGGLGVLIVVWLLRYSIALREIRWANA